MRKKKLKETAEDIKNLIDDIIDEKIDIPDKALIVPDAKTLIKVFTKKRMELIDKINKYQPQSVQELADITKRKKQAVDEDLKILKHYNIIELVEEGRKTVPIVVREVIVLNFKKPKREMPIVAETFVDHLNINKAVMSGIPI